MWLVNNVKPKRCNISNTRKSVSSDIQTLRSGLKKLGAAEFFKPTSKFTEEEEASQSINNS